MKTKKQHKWLSPSLLGKVGVGLLCGLMTSCNNGAKDAKALAELTESDVQISRIDPTDWYVGMKDPSLQLMVYGQGIREAEVKVKGAKLSDNGKCAIITDSDEGYGKVTIYDEKGSFIAAWESSDSGYPIDVTFSKDDSFFAISTVNTMGAVNRPYIRLFAIVDTGTKFSASDYGLYTSDDAQLFGSVVYGGNRLFTFTANKIFTLENDKLVALSGEYGAINYVNSVDDMLFMIYSDGINQKNSLAIINSKGETIYDSLIGSSVNAVSVKDDKYAVSVDNRIYIFKSNGNVISDISVDEEVLRIGFIENDKLVVISTGGVHTINY